MSRKINRAFLDQAKKNKNDEFYTQLIDIENELEYYRFQFQNQVVYLNCDDFRISNFFRYFVENFKALGLRKIICSCFKNDSSKAQGFWYEYTGVEDLAADIANNRVNYFTGNGDFRSSESIALLKSADVVVTNPPFSLFREFIAQLEEHHKKFLVIGNINCITYKEVFALIQANKAWLGINMGRGISGFIVPDHYELYGTETKINDLGHKIISPNNCLWLTNLDNAKRHQEIPLTKTYLGNEDYYPHYDNYHAINVNKTKDIPSDYHGCMGVPITFLHRFNPEQFEIVKFRKGDDEKDLRINGKPTYFRILIRRNLSGSSLLI